jgi:hypothetical protein
MSVPLVTSNPYKKSPESVDIDQHPFRKADKINKNVKSIKIPGHVAPNLLSFRGRETGKPTKLVPFTALTDNTRQITKKKKKLQPKKCQFRTIACGRKQSKTSKI